MDGNKIKTGSRPIKNKISEGYPTRCGKYQKDGRKTNKQNDSQNENRVTSVVVNSGATSTVGKPGDGFIPTD